MVDMMILFLVRIQMIGCCFQIDSAYRVCARMESIRFFRRQKEEAWTIYHAEAFVCAYFSDASLVNPYLLLYAAQFLFAFSLYGIGNLDVALQSLSEYRNCVLPVSIGTYIWLFLEIKVTACLVFGSLIVFFMITWKRFYAVSVCSYFWVMLIEYVYCIPL